MSLTSVVDARAAGRVAVPNHRRRGGVVLDVVIVNNMPDSALLATERQFRDAVHAAVGKTGARVRLTTLPSLPRGEDARRHIAVTYTPLDAILASSVDALIVTGNEPRAPRLDAEPYWSDLAMLVDWAAVHTRGTLWSCLAAHAAVLHLHAIERRPLPAKLSGVFRCRTTKASALLGGADHAVNVPHSRYNGLGKDDLLTHGYDILRMSDEAGVDVFTLDRGSRFVFLQGHPEYEPDTLAREYRRDVGRFLRGERDTYPDEPAAYFSAEASAVLRAFRRRATTHRGAALFDTFPNVVSPFAIANQWQNATTLLYRNWLAEIAARGRIRDSEAV